MYKSKKIKTIGSLIESDFMEMETGKKKSGFARRRIAKKPYSKKY